LCGSKIDSTVWRSGQKKRVPARWSSPLQAGRLLHSASVTDRFHELVTAADLLPVRLHDLRP
jgi:hypothetical protein